MADALLDVNKEKEKTKWSEIKKKLYKSRQLYVFVMAQIDQGYNLPAGKGGNPDHLFFRQPLVNGQHICHLTVIHAFLFDFYRSAHVIPPHD